MSALASFNHPFSEAELEISSCNLISANPLPLGFLKLNMNFNTRSGVLKGNNSNDRSDWSIEAKPLSVSITCYGLPVSLDCEFGPRILNSDAIFLMPISIESLKFIESKRKDDLQLHVSCVFDYTLIKSGTPLFGAMPNGTNNYRGSMSFNIKESESEWLKILKDLKYSNRMLIELESPVLDLPKTKGFEKVQEKIDLANNKLLEKKNPEDILSDLRSAWDIFDEYHNNYSDEINKLIGGKSKKEEKEPSKEDRMEAIHFAIKEYLKSINQLKKTIDKFTQIGPHRETYHSTIEDAELAFRLTTSLIAYYSKLLSKISTDSEVNE